MWYSFYDGSIFVCCDVTFRGHHSKFISGRNQSDDDNNKNKKPSALRFAFSACLFYNKQNFYCWTISFGKREWGTAEST